MGPQREPLGAKFAKSVSPSRILALFWGLLGQDPALGGSWRKEGPWLLSLRPPPGLAIPLLQRSLRALHSRTFHVSHFHFCPGLSFLGEEVSASVLLELKGAWGLDQLVWGMWYPLSSASRPGHTPLIRLPLPEDASSATVFGPQFVCRLLQSLRLPRHQGPSSTSPSSLWLSLPLGKRDPSRFGKCFLQRKLAPCSGWQGYI